LDLGLTCVQSVCQGDGSAPNSDEVSGSAGSKSSRSGCSRSERREGQSILTLKLTNYATEVYDLWCAVPPGETGPEGGSAPPCEDLFPTRVSQVSPAIICVSVSRGAIRNSLFFGRINLCYEASVFDAPKKRGFDSIYSRMTRILPVIVTAGGGP
jgi:hypothetical protein